MGETTIFLAKLMGPVLVLVGLSFALKKDEYMVMFKKVIKERAYLFLQGIVESTAGLAIVLAQNLWSSPVEIFISLMGWMMLIEGGLTLLSSKNSIKNMMRVCATPQLMMLITLFVLVLGAFFSWVGYFL